MTGEQIIVSTDTFLVSPLKFSGGNIGGLAVNGTLNDLAMMGADPQHMTVGFVLEEELLFDLLERAVTTMAGAVWAAGVPVVTCHTKVVERGKANGMDINTTGVRVMADGFRPAPGVPVASTAAGADVHALAVLRAHPPGSEAAIVRTVVDAHPGLVILKPCIGGSGVVDSLPGNRLRPTC